MTVAIGLGSRFPAFQTSMGRVLLAELDDDRIRDVFARSDRSRPTPHTVTDVDQLLAAIAEVRHTGWSVVDQELEVGIRSVAAPIRDGNGCAVAAVNVSTHAGRSDLDQVHAVFVPAVVETAGRISEALARR